ncbi:D-amino-acid dehydrogenase [Rhizobium sp. BK077]|uniref:D-amino acid dehydrogenase n=1 Tax=unclassified Rhizobium TaxID=2613769 RepID=UPI00161B1E54|nr:MULTISPECIES: D-amino acid dehydrogenase [unclassified Rhizobium]MBB3302219.1 D-amino-acid dehydrogenase [Rhizobium sp. BK112]MBB3371341.1 D-amino-acid dehydrogenase [Rhizobium sp. BK077]MBB4182171.1 D-amino-acid dehydrogenase [Rhizobium sp. BK109]MBB4255600.1 D-amino-acid dehydrogenase [Rhizobium sp. BK008]
MPHIVVLGAGITGVTTAYALSRRGFDVTVIDRHRYPAMETSFANGGQLSASNAEVWNHWSTVAKGIKWMLKSDAPLLLNPTPSWHKYSWMGEFLGNIGNYRSNTIETTRLAIAARKHMFEIADEEEIEFDLEKRGILHVYYDKASFDHASQVNAMLVQAGLDRKPVTASEIRTIEPALVGDFFGGFFTPSDSTGDIHKFTRGLAAACVKRGVKFVFDANVDRLVSQGGVKVIWKPTGSEDGKQSIIDADSLVICAGVASRRFADMLGDRINVYPVKGYSITVHLDDRESQSGAPWTSLLDDRAKIVTSRLGVDRFRVAGTAEFNGVNRDIRQDRINPLTEWVRTLFPKVATSRVVPWAGLRPMMPNMMPRVRSGSRPGVFYNTGHGHLGWTLSAATAELVAEMILKHKTKVA